MDPKLLDVLVCPICKSALRYDRDAQELVCRADRLAYPIRDGIPVMLEEEARQLDAPGQPSPSPTPDPAPPPPTGEQD